MPKEDTEQEKRFNKNKHRANGRSYGDLSEEERNSKLNGYAEMDTVEGVKGSKMLMTLINKKTSFLFGIPISSKKQENIIKELDKLENIKWDIFCLSITTVTLWTRIAMNLTKDHQSLWVPSRTCLLHNQKVLLN